MTKALAHALRVKAGEVARIFSNPDRAKNFSKETFTLKDLVPLSESTAAGYYLKPSQKMALVFFYYLNSGKAPRWEYFFVTDSHALGMDRVSDLLAQVEHVNFPHNWTQPANDATSFDKEAV